MPGLSDVTRTSIVQSLTARELPLAVDVYLVYCTRSAIVPVGTLSKCHDHDFIYYNITPSITLKMNIGKTPDESLYSGVQEVNGVVHVALYYATCHPSTP